MIKGYKFLEIIGEGGFGAVYRANQTLVDREVAIKVILPEYANQPEFIRRFDIEAKIVAQLEHFHIVPLYDYWREPDGAYLVMRLMKGGSLETALQEKAWDVEKIVVLGDQIASALESAHQQSVVHRDLKPANILLDEEGNAFLSDFGIAKALNSDSNVTETEVIKGTPAYITPEQAQSRPSTIQTDIYSLGVVLYEILVGDHPFPDTPTMMMISKHLNEPLPLVSEKRSGISENVDAVIQKATAKDPKSRYEDVRTLLRDFRRALKLDPNTTQINIPDQEIFNPFKGLNAFQESDEDDFYGRDTLTAQLIARLGEAGEMNRFLAVVGPSGSGKSSVVKAGLIPELRKGKLPGSEDWFVVELKPGAHPMEELELALMRVAVNQPDSLLAQLKEDTRGLLRAARRILPDDGELVLVVDQLEEVFTLVKDQDEAAFFLQSLYEAVMDANSPLRIIVTLRADFYDRPLMHPKFSGLIQKQTEVVVPLTAEELSRAIRNPAERVGIVLETDLVAKIVADVVDQPGALPLLQYALTELFDRRKGRLLNDEGYQEIGGVLGALGRRTEEVYDSLDIDGKATARQLFLRLVTLGEGTEDTRRRVLSTELASLSVSISDIIDVFGEARMLSFDRHPITRASTVEIAHEALIREWDRLRVWLNDNRDELRFQRQLSSVTQEWQSADNDPSFLLRGSRLDQIQAWVDETQLALTQIERDYLAASLQAREQRQKEESTRQARETALEKRSRNVLRVLVGVFAVAAMLSFWFANNASQAQQSAENETLARSTAEAVALEAEAAALQERDSAQEAVQLALSRQLAFAANNYLNTDPDLSLILALEAADLTSQEGTISFEVEDALHRALTSALPQELFRIWQLFSSVSISPDGSRLLVTYNEGEPGNRDNLALILDISPGAAGEELMRLEGHTNQVVSARYNLAGTLIATGSQDGSIILWDAFTGQPLRTLIGHLGKVQDIEFSPDGTRLVSASLDTTAIVWDVVTGEPLLTLSGHTGFINQATFKPNGEHIATASADDTAIIWDASSGERLFTLSGHYGHTESITSIDYSPEGTHLATGSEDGNVILWSPLTGQALTTICCLHRQSPGGGVQSLEFSPDSTQLLTFSRGNETKVWDISISGKESELFVLTFPSRSYTLANIAISPDNHRMFSAIEESDREFLIAWDISFGREVLPLSSFSDDILSTTFSPDSTLLAAASADRTVSVWNISENISQTQNLFTLPAGSHSGEVNALVFSPDGALLAAASSGKEITLWGIPQNEDETPTKLITLSGHTGPVLAVDFHPEGNLLASASTDRNAIIWQLSEESGEELFTLRDHNGPVTDVSFSPDGDMLATTSADDTAILWQLSEDRSNASEIFVLRDHEDEVLSAVFNPDNTLLVTASADGTAIVWEVSSGENLFTLLGHTGAVNQAVFTPDGNRIATSGEDGLTILWDAATGRELFTLSGHTDAINSLAISPDGVLMATGSADQTVNFYILDIGTLVTFAQTHNTRSMTDEECQQYLFIDVCPESDE